jgi:hypothetical protein
VLKNPPHNSGEGSDQGVINRQLLELVISQFNRVNELTFEVRALRALFEAGGSDPVPPDEFAKVVEAVKARLPVETGESLQRIQRLVSELKEPTQ